MMPTRSVLEHVTDSLGRRDPDPFIALLADDAVFELASGPAGDVERFEGKAAIAELVGGMRHVHHVEAEPYRLYIDGEAEVAAFESSWIVQDTPDAPPIRITQAMFGEFRDGLVVAWRVYRYVKPSAS